MQFKTDTKEKFHVITVDGPILSANMTEELAKTVTTYLKDADAPVRNVIVNLSNIAQTDIEAATALAELQQQFYEANVSFVIYGLQKEVEKFLDENELLELMNVTPSESEAWDIVQMEEIERDLLNEDDN